MDLIDNVSAGEWIDYRPELKIIDCTIRDGGLMNKHHFSDDFVKATYETCVRAGVDYIELGYKNDPDLFSPEEFGKWKYCREEDLREVIGEKAETTRISVMADVGRCNLKRDFLPASESYIDMVRVACYIHQIPEAIDMIHHIHSLGYEVSANLMAISVIPDWELVEAIKRLAATPIEVLYIVDSFGSLHTDQIQHLTRSYLNVCNEHGRKVGIHAHNNMQMAFSNSIISMIMGASFMDGSLGGLGRGAGNCPTELFLGFLHNPKYHLRPALDFIEAYINPLRETIKWGYDTAYMLTGLLNQHPRAAIAFYEKDSKKSLTRFYDELMDLE